ncbi:MAG: hypothetical protein IJV69_06945 [Kiritimatiellae bacterium]|nr:hypothetical protein [Kiritimatiellia bacterium]
MDTLISPRQVPGLPPDLLPLERELCAVDGKAALTHYDTQLILLEQRLRTAVAKGLPPSDYQRCSELQACLIVARKLLRLAQQPIH